MLLKGLNHRADAFLGSITKYKLNEGLKSERSIYFKLFSAPDYMEREIASKRKMITRPRLHMCIESKFFFLELKPMK